MRTLVFVALTSLLQSYESAEIPESASVARGMMSYIQWGALVTTSIRTEGTNKGDAFGNPNSIADVDGVPYIYGSSLDASFVDIEGSTDKRVSLALSEASLASEEGSANVTAREIGAGDYGDPENPPCARMVVSGAVSKPVVDSAEEIEAKAALFARHPSFKNMPDDHGFFVAKIDIDGIWIVDAYGGATDLSLTEYYAATPVRPGLLRNTKKSRASSSDRLTSKERIPPPTHPVLTRRGTKLRTPSSGQYAAKDRDLPPLPSSKVRTARWMAKNLDYGFLCTTSTRSVATSVGTAFGNPYSFADVEGVPYVFSSALDASAIDLFLGGKSAAANPRGSLALSEASYPARIMSNCKIGGVLGDPENPLCARLVLTGVFTKVVPHSAEDMKAKGALFSRHPSFENYPKGHNFFVCKLNIDGIWLIDVFGGAAIIEPKDYFNAKDISSTWEYDAVAQ